MLARSRDAGNSELNMFEDEDCTTPITIHGWWLGFLVCANLCERLSLCSGYSGSHACTNAPTVTHTLHGTLRCRSRRKLDPGHPHHTSAVHIVCHLGASTNYNPHSMYGYGYGYGRQFEHVGWRTRRGRVERRSQLG